MSLGGLLSIACGAYFWLYASGKVGAKPENPAYVRWMSRFGRPMRIMAPLVVVFGILELLGAFSPRANAPVSEDLKKRIESLSDGESFTDSKTGFAMTLHSKAAGVPDSTGWYGVASTHGRFKVALPGPGVDFTQDLPPTDGVATRVSIVGLKTTEGVRFTVTSMARADKTVPSDYVAKALSGLAPASPTQISRGAMSGSRVSLERSDSVFEMEVFVVQDRAYQIMVEYPPSEKSYMPEVSRRFFESFRAQAAV